MDLEQLLDPKQWQVKVRSVDDSLHAALAAQRRPAARSKPFWKRGVSRLTDAPSSPARQQNAAQTSLP